ncbi:aquaporin-11 [Rhinoraja longicauda]
MENVLVSMGTVAGTVTVCQVLRQVARGFLKPRCSTGRGGQSQSPLLQLAIEFISTLQLCICTHELRLLGESGMLSGLGPSLALVYLVTLVHLSTFGGASCNPVNTLEQFLCGQCSGRLALSKILLQLVAALAARRVSETIWALHMSDLHWHHCKNHFKCISAMKTSTLSSGMFVEFSCAFSLRAVIIRFQHLSPRRRMFLVAGIITFLVFAAGGLTGAVFNPALAYSITFHCEGYTFLEYTFAYWLGPLLGALTAVMLFDKNMVCCANVAVQTRRSNMKRD